MSFQREVLPVINLLVHVRRFIRTCARNIIYGTVDHKQPICDPAASIADRMSGSIAIDSLRRRRAIIREDDDWKAFSQSRRWVSFIPNVKNCFTILFYCIIFYLFYSNIYLLFILIWYYSAFLFYYSYLRRILFPASPWAFQEILGRWTFPTPLSSSPQIECILHYK